MPNHGALEAWQTNETYQPLGNVPTGRYVSKRTFFCNKPQGYALRNAAAMSCWLRASAGSASHIRPRRFWMGISPKCALSHVTRFSLPRNSRCRLKYKAFISLFQRYMNLEMFPNPSDIHVQHRFIFILRFQRVSAVRAVCWSLISPDTLFTADETGIVVAWDARINRWVELGNLGIINMQSFD